MEKLEEKLLIKNEHPEQKPMEGENNEDNCMLCKTLGFPCKFFSPIVVFTICIIDVLILFDSLILEKNMDLFWRQFLRFICHIILLLTFLTPDYSEWIEKEKDCVEESIL